MGVSHAGTATLLSKPQASPHPYSHDDGDGDLIVDPLLKYLNKPKFQNEHLSPRFDVDDAINSLKNQGYYIIPSVLTHEECDRVLDRLWDFVEDVSGGCVRRGDPTSWYPKHEVVGELAGKDSIGGTTPGAERNPTISYDSSKHDDLDPWPHTGYGSFPDMFQSLGAGYVLGDVRQCLADRVFEPLFGTRELLCSKEGFTFCRPLVVSLDNDGIRWENHDIEGKKESQSNGTINNVIVWRPHHLKPSSFDKGNMHRERPLFQVCSQPQPLSEGQHYDQGVPASTMRMRHTQNQDCANDTDSADMNGVSKKQQNKKKRISNKQRKFKDKTGLCHIQASVSFTDQGVDENRGGGHFLCHPRSHSTVHCKLVGGTYRATPAAEGVAKGKKMERPDPTWVPLTDKEISQLAELGCPERRIYANRGDVILWRSDLVHAGVAPSLIVDKDNEGKSGGSVAYDGPREFRAVAYCSMLPINVARDYALYSLPRQKLTRTSGAERCQSFGPTLDKERVDKMLRAKEEELLLRKLESYRTGRTGDHRPDVESWHGHRRVTMWNLNHDGCQLGGNAQQKHHLRLPVPPRMLQRPRFRLGPPAVTVREAELYGLLPYRQLTSDAGFDERTRQKDIERAVIRGVRFVEGVYKGSRHTDCPRVGSLAMKEGNISPGNRCDGSVGDIPICLARMEKLTPHSINGGHTGLSGQDKYLGGMASPCGRAIYGVPGHAKRVVRVDVSSGEVTFIGPQFAGEFKWLRGVEIPGVAMGLEDDGSLSHPSGCCLALPCNSENGCVLKIDPATSEVTTFVTGPPIPNVEEGWLYHGGNLSSDGFVYAIPASASRVMKIDPRLESTEWIGPEYLGKAKWYGGITGADECIYGIPHNSTGVLKIDPETQEVTVLAEGSLPEGRWKWHGGLASLDGSKIIGFPNNADSVLVIDVSKQEVYTVGNSSIIQSGYHRVPSDGRYKYLGGALTADGKFAYLFPCDAEYVLRFDMETDEVKLVGPHLTEGENKFQNGFVGKDGCVYGIPQRASGVLRIIPPGVKRFGRNGNALPSEEEYVDVIYCGDDMVSCKDKFEGGVLGMDGKIYCIPLRAKSFVNIIPITNEN